MTPIDYASLFDQIDKIKFKQDYLQSIVCN